MQKLTHENFIKARDYIFKHSDNINRVWYRYNFEAEDTTVFMDALAKYQHEDGGFGGLMYEFAYQGSCLKCTEHALRYMFYLKEKPASNHPVIQKTMKYLLGRYRPDIGHFGHMEEPELNELPHVSWWGYNADQWPPMLILSHQQPIRPCGDLAVESCFAKKNSRNGRIKGVRQF